MTQKEYLDALLEQYHLVHVMSVIEINEMLFHNNLGTLG